MTRVIIYMRVSTDEQGRSGLGLAAQRRTCRAYVTLKDDWTIAGEYTDEKSAKSLNGRHELAKALEALDQGEADVLLVAKLDRLSRSVVDFGGILQRADKHKWALAVRDMDLDTTTANGKLVANVLMALAEWERETISERTKAALASIPRGTTHVDREGNVKGPPGGPVKIDAETAALVRYMKDQGKTYRAICDELTALGKATPRGGPWQVSTIQRILAR
jgi:DNA invertase Pin-like site-specific DNA recombinase